MSRLPLRSILGTVALLLLASGCFVSTEQPLSDPQAARPDPLLVGMWRDATGKDKSIGRVHFDAQGKAHSDQQAADGHWEKDAGPSDFFVTRTAKASYINLAYFEPDKQHPGRQRRFYQFLRYHVSGDGRTLTLVVPKTEPFRRALRTGQLKGRFEPVRFATQKGDSDAVVLQDSPGAILRFLEARPERELFDVANVLKKVD